MREILFRGKTVRNADWVYGFPITKVYGAYSILVDAAAFEDDESVNFSYYFIDKDSLGQYTGINDKNGKKIFEGDIICLCNGATYPMLVFYDGLGFKFRYSNGRLKDGCWDCDIMNDVQKCEVIGNIFDNPELLEFGNADADE